jgi:dTMP kinase
MKRFITFEGIDGSGKSTVSKLVFEKLKEQGYDVIYTFEPTNSWIGKIVQENIKTKADPFETAFTFIADRVNHCKVIQKWLDDNKMVLCDRYAESTYAYQAAQMEQIINKPIKWLKELSENRIIIPDKTFLFVIEPKDALSRIQDRNELIPFEKADFLTKVHNNYLKLATGNRFVKLDATKTIDELVDICIGKIIS